MWCCPCSSLIGTRTARPDGLSTTRGTTGPQEVSVADVTGGDLAVSCGDRGGGVGSIRPPPGRRTPLHPQNARTPRRRPGPIGGAGGGCPVRRGGGGRGARGGEGVEGGG